MRTGIVCTTRCIWCRMFIVGRGGRGGDEGGVGHIVSTGRLLFSLLLHLF